MTRVLHVTNGDAAGDGIAATGLGGQVLPWRDVLHDGPVPAGLGPAELAEVRARFIAGCGWGAGAEVARGFAERDATLAAAIDGDTPIVLWFEHDLYDQLQLLQILDRFAGRALDRVSAIVIGEHPQVPDFRGLGQLSPAQLAALWPARQPVTPDQVALASRAWAAFRAPDPTGVQAMIDSRTAGLPWLHAALVRLLAEYPALGTGLARTEAEIVRVALRGTATPAELFDATQAAEPAPFMGDSSFGHRIATLCNGPAPLLAPTDSRRPHGGFDPGASDAFGVPLAATPLAAEVAAGRVDWAARNKLDRWIGGVRLVGTRPAWRWDPAADRIVNPNAPDQ